MRRVLRRLGLAALIAAAAPGAAGAWEISRFDARVAVEADGTATVTETIVASFGPEARHGIYRDIPIHYSDRAGQHFRLRLRVRSVDNGLGAPWRYRLEPEGRSLRIRIGDPDATVTGTQTYRIFYEVQRGAVRFFPDHDECYWNMTGNEWAVPIRGVLAEVRLPRPAAQARAVGYRGAFGSTAQVEPAARRPDSVLFSVPQGLQPYEGLTVALAWEKGIIRPPSALRVLAWWITDNWVYGIPLLVLLGMLAWWHDRGRDPRPGALVVEYAPPVPLTPAEAGTLLDQHAHMRDITATVIDLAVRGYVRIEPLTAAGLFGGDRIADYQLFSLKPWAGAQDLKPYERHLLEGLFAAPLSSRQLSDLEQMFYTKLPEIRSSIYAALVHAGHLDSDPETVRNRYLVWGWAVGLGLHFLLGATVTWHQLPKVPCLIAAVLSGVIILLFSRFMPRRTHKGAAMTDRVAGFMEFLRRVDEDRIRRINDPGLFERGLPYAMAFGLAAHWAKAFEGLATTPPSWYGGDTAGFSPRRFGDTMDRMGASMGRTFTSQPRGSSSSWGGSGSGGGGFSGGGGGGGGGGSW